MFLSVITGCASNDYDSVKVDLLLCSQASYSTLCIRLENKTENDIYLKDFKGVQRYIHVYNVNQNFKDITNSFFENSFLKSLQVKINVEKCCQNDILNEYFTQKESDSIVTIFKSSIDSAFLRKFKKDLVENYLRQKIKDIVLIKSKQIISESYIIENAQYSGKNLIVVFNYPQGFHYIENPDLKSFTELDEFIFPSYIKGYYRYSKPLKSDTTLLKIP